MSEFILHYTSIDSVLNDINRIKNTTDKNGCTIVRDLFDPIEIDKLNKSITENFDVNLDVRRSGDYKKNMEDFQRLDLGEYPSSSRFCRYFFYFPWNNNEQFTLINKKLLRIRNSISNKPENFGIIEKDKDPNRFSASYVIQYPLGGGFMSKHREYDIKENGDNAYVVYILLTTRGVDFKSGGAYAFNENKEIDIDKFAQKGDLIIYRGDRYHGVHNIDDDKSPSLSQINGRMMLTTIINYFKE